MWTEEQQARQMVAQRKERKGYPTDIGDMEWIVVEPLLPGKASPTQGGPSSGHQCTSISGPFTLRVADAAKRFPSLSNGVLLVSSFDTTLLVSDDS